MQQMTEEAHLSAIWRHFLQTAVKGTEIVTSEARAISIKLQDDIEVHFRTAEYFEPFT